MITDETHAIPRRDIHFEVAAQAKPDWLDNDPYRSAFCDGLSIFFPQGERFFIRSLTHYLSRVEVSSSLREEVRAFSLQESMHTREHEAYNIMLKDLGYPVARMEDRTFKALAGVKNPLTCLAVTVATEHLTATLAEVCLLDDKHFASAPPAYRDLWTWHCLEEMEHKGVAFDMFRIVTQNMSGWQRYALRCSALLKVTFDIHMLLLSNVRDILKARGISASLWVVLGKWVGDCFVTPGYYRRSLGYYLSFFMPGFDPWKVGKAQKRAKPWRDYLNARAGITDHA